MATRTSTRSTRKRERPKSSLARKIKIAVLLLLMPLAVLALAGGTYFAFLLNSAAEEIPSIEQKMASMRVGPTRIMSADGKLLYESASEFRIPVDFEEIPEVVRNATLAAEDKRFYDHNGVDPWAVGRQVFTNVREQRVAGGASTLTMQLAKRLYTSSDQTVKRKLEDAALALQMERKLTKNQILGLYLNQVFYGSGAYGIAAAAQVYFDKPLHKITLSEAAMLARVVRRPSDENPISDYETALKNRDVVLDIMLEENMINRSEYDAAKTERPKVVASREHMRATIKDAPYFVRYILEAARADLGEDVSNGGYTIETTLDTRLQNYAEQRARRLVRTYRRSGVTTTAFMIMNRSGEILSMVGGVDYERNQFNAVTQGRRQPGSAFKPLVYAAAFEQGVLTPNDGINAATYRARDGDRVWEVEGRRSAGSVSVRSAIAFSMNPPAVRAMEMVRPKIFAEGYARRVFGLTTPILPVPSMVLGAVEVRPIELAEAFTVFQHGGDRVKPFGIRRVLDSGGREVRRFEPKISRNVLSNASAEDMDDCLRAVVTQGTGTNASSVRRARGKTGTTNDNRDAWFVGYTDNYLAVSWVANEQFDESSKSWVYRPMRDYVMGGKVPILMWRDVVRQAQELFGEPTVRPDPDDRRAERERYVASDGEESVRNNRELGRVREESAEETTESPAEAVPSTDQTPDQQTPTADPTPAPTPTPDPSPPSLPDGNTDVPDDPGGGVTPPPNGT